MASTKALFAALMVYLLAADASARDSQLDSASQRSKPGMVASNHLTNRVVLFFALGTVCSRLRNNPTRSPAEGLRHLLSGSDLSRLRGGSRPSRLSSEGAASLSRQQQQGQSSEEVPSFQSPAFQFSTAEQQQQQVEEQVQQAPPRQVPQVSRRYSKRIAECRRFPCICVCALRSFLR
jgi:hypothetical protein